MFDVQLLVVIKKKFTLWYQANDKIQ